MIKCSVIKMPCIGVVPDPNGAMVLRKNQSSSDVMQAAVMFPHVSGDPFIRGFLIFFSTAELAQSNAIGLCVEQSLRGSGDWDSLPLLCKNIVQNSLITGDMAMHAKATLSKTDLENSLVDLIKRNMLGAARVVCNMSGMNIVRVIDYLIEEGQVSEKSRPDLLELGDTVVSRSDFTDALYQHKELANILFRIAGINDWEFPDSESIREGILSQVSQSLLKGTGGIDVSAKDLKSLGTSKEDLYMSCCMIVSYDDELRHKMTTDQLYDALTELSRHQRSIFDSEGPGNTQLINVHSSLHSKLVEEIKVRGDGCPCQETVDHDLDLQIG